jgi:hypothetical protein
MLHLQLCIKLIYSLPHLLAKDRSNTVYWHFGRQIGSPWTITRHPPNPSGRDDAVVWRAPGCLSIFVHDPISVRSRQLYEKMTFMGFTI